MARRSAGAITLNATARSETIPWRGPRLTAEAKDPRRVLAKLREHRRRLKARGRAGALLFGLLALVAAAGWYFTWPVGVPALCLFLAGVVLGCLMPNRRLSSEELGRANVLLESIRVSLRELAGEDADLLFAYRRKVYKELILSIAR